MKNNYIDRVILFHDIDSSKRIGLQKLDSRYLLSWNVINKAIEDARKKSIEFEHLKLKSQKKINKIVRITIDDGGGSSIELAKLLAKKNIKAYFFIPTKFIGKNGFLTKVEINKLYKMGHKIGSHSHSHPNPFCELSKFKIIDEVLESKKIIEEIIDEKVNIFSVPGGEIRKDTLITLSDDVLELDEIYISTPYQGKYFFSSKIGSQVYGRMCIERKMSYKMISNYIIGKGWRFAFINYQLRRFRRELIYKYNQLFSVK